jgi:hypothetical protein
VSSAGPGENFEFMPSVCQEGMTAHQNTQRRRTTPKTSSPLQPIGEQPERKDEVALRQSEGLMTHS